MNRPKNVMNQPCPASGCGEGMRNEGPGEESVYSKREDGYKRRYAEYRPCIKDDEKHSV